MKLARKESDSSREFWKAAETIVRQIESWPSYKKDIVVSSDGSGYKRQDSDGGRQGSESRPD